MKKLRLADSLAGIPTQTCLHPGLLARRERLWTESGIIFVILKAAQLQEIKILE